MQSAGLSSGPFCGRQTHINSVDPPFSNETSGLLPLFMSLLFAITINTIGTDPS